ncbi:MAG: EAL domain-containing protein [Solirubrobacteraceae bacterium]
MSRSVDHRRQSALHDVVVAASSLLDPTNLAAVVVAQVRRLLDVDGASLALWDPEQQVLVPLAFDDERMSDPDPVFHPGQGMIGEAFARDGTIVVDDYARELAHPPVWATVCSGVAVPLRAAGGPLGVLSAQQYTFRRFTTDDVEALEAIAAQVAPALATMSTLARAQRRTAEAYALATLMRRGAAQHDGQAVFALVCETALKLLGADLAGLVLRDATGSGSAWRGVVGNRTASWERRRYGGTHPAASTIFGGRTEVIRGIDGGPLDAQRFPFFAAEGIRVGVAIPLDPIDGSQGSLCLGWRFHVDPSERQLELAGALAAFSGTLVAAAAARAQRDALVANAPVVLAAMDADGILTLCEGAGAAAIGAGPDDVGRHVSELLADEPVALAALMEAARRPAPAQLCLEARGRSFDARLVVHQGGAFLVATDVTERRDAERELVRRATEDELTGLPNEAEVVSVIAEELARATICVAIADVRNFDHVNEAIGYDASDELLRVLGTRLALDLPDAVVVGRTGGDEFAVAARGANAATLGARVRESLEAFVGQGTDDAIAVDVRCGVAWMRAGGDAQLLLRQADAALQLARRGTETVIGWDETAASRRRDQHGITARVRRALDAGAFTVVYQPITDMRTGALRGVEALARWATDGGDVIEPAVFVSLAERLGRVGRLTAHVLDLALSEVAAPYGVSVSVNISPLDVMHGDLPALVSDRLAAHGLDPGALTLELTESAALEAGAPGLEQVAKMGVGIAVDDFGRGWSSLELLKRLPARHLKLDRSYVARAAVDPADEAIVHAAVTLGHAFGMQVVAEGIEDASVLDAVGRLGCDHAQGYHVARPMAAHALGDWLSARGE